MDFQRCFKLGVALIVAVAAWASCAPQHKVAAIASPRHVLILGDSIAWGQGLSDRDKMHSLLSEAYSRAGEPAPTFTSPAHSGAIVGPTAPSGHTPGPNGEIPTPFPTVNDEVNTAAGFGTSFDTIIVTGCANDVGFENFAMPFKLDRPALDTLVDKYCYTRLANLLGQIKQKLTTPSTRVIVLTYYPILSHSSKPPLWNLASVYLFNQLPKPLRYDLTRVSYSAVAKLVHECNASPVSSCNAEMHALEFAWRSTCDIVRAVESVDAIGETCHETDPRPIKDTLLVQGIRKIADRATQTLTGKQFVVAVPDIATQRSAFVPDDSSSDSWIWGATPADGIFALKPMDSPEAIKFRTRKNCDKDLFCAIASIGHPNRCGEIAYANAIIAILNREQPTPVQTLPPTSCRY